MMGSLATETPYSEVTETLELLSSRGVTRYDLSELRTNHALLEQVVSLIKNFGGETLQVVAPGKPVNRLELTAKTRKCLEKAGISHFIQLLGISEEDLRDIRNFGTVSVREVREYLVRYDFTLPHNSREWDECVLSVLRGRSEEELGMPLTDVPRVSERISGIPQSLRVSCALITLGDLKLALERNAEPLEDRTWELTRAYGACMRAHFR